MDPFATLGLPRSYAIDRDELERRYRELQKALHPDRHASAPASARKMSLLKAVEVSEAYRVLRDDMKRAHALLALLGAKADGPDDTAADPEFLMEVMELREALGEAKDAGDLERVRALSESVEAKRVASQAALVEAFDTLPEAPSVQDLEPLRALLGRLAYFRRFMDEVDVIEEQALT